MHHGRISEGRIDDTHAAVRLFGPHFAGLEHEQLRVAHLAADHRLLAERVFAGAGREEVALPLRPIMREALLLDATGLILAHNHPSGHAEPSAADRSATRRLLEVARPLGIELIDHLIFAGDAVVSFRALGLL